MSYRVLRPFFATVSLSVLYVLSASTAKATTVIHTNQAAFIAASQNLKFYDFQDQPLSHVPFQLVIDGITFQVPGGPVGISLLNNTTNKVVVGGTIGEFTQMTVFLPAGTTAVAFQQFTAPMNVFVSAGGQFTFTQAGPTFVGFTSDVPIDNLLFTVQAPQNSTAGDVILDNLFVGQVAPPASTFDFCIQDESSGYVLKLNSSTGEYEFRNCGAVVLSGVGMVTRRGSTITLQDYRTDRRVLARIDDSAKKGVATIMLLSPAMSFSIADRNTSSICSCS